MRRNAVRREVLAVLGDDGARAADDGRGHHVLVVTIATNGTFIGLASGSTVVTAEQVAALGRVVNLQGCRVVVAYDADGPGQEAAQVTLPAGTTRASWRSPTPGRLLTALERARPLEDSVVDQVLARCPRGRIGQRASAGRWATRRASSSTCPRIGSGGSRTRSRCLRPPSPGRCSTWWTRGSRRREGGRARGWCCALGERRVRPAPESALA